MNSPNRDEPIDEFLHKQFGTEIKPGREERILREDPELARRVDQMLRAEPLPEGVVAPITTAMPQSTPPIEYVLHIWTYKCTLCNSEHKHSEIYGVNHLRSRTGSGAYVRNMSPVSRLEWQVPLKVHNITTRTTAGCFECLDAIREEILPSLPRPPVPQAIVSSGAQAPARTVKEPKRSGPMTTDDFMV